MVTIDILSDDVLLQIFRFYQVVGPNIFSYRAQKWRTLVHVCRSWRGIVFASPYHLDLQLVCTARTRQGDVGYLATPTHSDMGLWVCTGSVTVAMGMCR